MRASKYYADLLYKGLCPFTLVVGQLLYYTYYRHQEVVVDKENVINRWFVKKGWFWTTVVLWYVGLKYQTVNKRFIKRYGLATLWWWIFTQGFASLSIPPIMDLCFVWTGGDCSFDVFDHTTVNPSFQDNEYRRSKSLRKIYGLLLASTVGKPDKAHSNILQLVKCSLTHKDCSLSNYELANFEKVNSYIRSLIYSIEPMAMKKSATCRQHGGHWIGGHDPSGHIFITTMMIMLLLRELPRVGRKFFQVQYAEEQSKKDTNFLKSFTQLFDNGALWNILNEQSNSTMDFLYKIFVSPLLMFLPRLARFFSSLIEYVFWENPIYLELAFLLMWWYSFYITIIAFHTVYEQITGFLCSYIVMLLIY